MTDLAVTVTGTDVSVWFGTRRLCLAAALDVLMVAVLVWDYRRFQRS